MKNIFRLTLIVITALLLTSGVALAASQTSSILATGQTYTGLYARAADTITINGDVQGDVWVAGSSIDINGHVTGNVYAAGSTVRVHGEVTGSVHAAASTVDVSSHVGGSVYAAGSSVVIAGESRIDGAAALAGSEVSVGGQLGQQLYAAGSTITISGHVGQFANLAATEISLTDQATIAGDLKYSSANEAHIANDQAIGGAVNHVASRSPQSNPWRDRLMASLFGFACNLLLGAVLLRFGDRLVRAGTTQLSQRPFQVFIYGLFFLGLFPLLLVFVALTLIGLPLAALGVFAYLTVIIIAPVLASYALGARLTPKLATLDQSRYRDQVALLGLGLIVFTILCALPIIGGLASLIFYAAGAGMVVSRGFQPLMTGQTRAKFSKPAATPAK